MILIGLYIYIFCGILWLIKTRAMVKSSISNPSFKNVAMLVLFIVICWLPLYIYGRICFIKGYIIGTKERLEKEEEEHKEN